MNMNEEIRKMDLDEYSQVRDNLPKYVPDEQDQQIIEYCCNHQKNMKEVFKCPRLEVKQSKLNQAGNGLFTNEPIKANTIICYYPCNVFYNMQDPEVFYKEGELMKEGIKGFTHDEIWKVYQGDYNLNILPYKIVCYDGSPYPNELYAGHFTNDRGYNPKKRYKEHMNNRRFEALNIVASRDIKAGEEIYVSYGQAYWFDLVDMKEKSRHMEMKEKLKL